jgi:hypothetical protein
LLFSNTDITTAGASLFYDNIGTNANYDAGAGDTHFLGSIYAGGDVDLGAAKVVGSNGSISHIDLEDQVLAAVVSDGIISVDGFDFPTFPEQWERVIANGNANLTTGATGESRIFDSLDANTASEGTTSGLSAEITVSQLSPIENPTPPPTYSTVSQDGATIGSGADTVAAIAMPPVTDLTGFTETLGDQICPPTCTMTLNPNTLTSGYGVVTLGQGNNPVLKLRNDLILGGDYYIEEIFNNGNLTLKIDLTNGPVNIYVDGHINIGQRSVLWVTDAAIATHPDATTDGYLPISHPDAQHLAGDIYWEITGRFTMNGPDTATFENIFGGTLYSTWDSTGDGIDNGQHIDWFGALWAADTIALADHSRYTFVPLDGEVPIPEPATMLLLGTGLAGVAGAARRKKKNQA